jgi:spermidine/putrescine transport system ATP-binding protein
MPEPRRAMIELTGVSKSFATRDLGVVAALKAVSLRIEGNEFFTLLGPSGCGKTTLLRLIGGFEAPSTGRIQIDAQDVAVLPPQKRPVNTVFQSYALFPHMTVAGNVTFGLEMCGWRKAEIAARVEEVLTLVHLDGFGGRRPAQLSGGQQQRVALARALAPRPKVLLLDEPLSALDLKLRKEMQGELKRLQRETGITFVLVTHDQEEALAMSDRIAVMRDGLVLQVGTPQAIYDNPNSRFVADFIGEANLVPGHVLGRSEALTVAVRPERVTLARLNGHAARAKGEVAGATFLGLDTLYEVLLDGARVRARVRDAGETFKPGDTVALHWPETAERELLH